jgi:hypothetical protein
MNTLQLFLKLSLQIECHMVSPCPLTLLLVFVADHGVPVPVVYSEEEVI